MKWSEVYELQVPEGRGHLQVPCRIWNQEVSVKRVIWLSVSAVICYYFQFLLLRTRVKWRVVMDESSLGGGQDVKVHDNLSNFWSIFGNLLSIDLLQKVPLDQHVIQGVKRYTTLIRWKVLLNVIFTTAELWKRPSASRHPLKLIPVLPQVTVES